MESSQAEQLRAEVSRLLASETFLRSPALGRLLNYLVEQVLAGEAAGLKESVIGHELYGRPAGYDPKLDSVVRVSANRLRLRLEDHYRTNRSARVRVVLPKGSYVPLLEIAEDPAPIPVADEESPAPEDTAGAKRAEDRSLLKPQFALMSLFVVLLLVILATLFRRTSQHSQNASAETDWNVRPFARLGGSQQFGVFSPDGSQVAFNSTTTNGAEKAIYLQTIGSEEARRITVGVRPSWSPDGKHLAFLRPEDDTRRWVILRDMVTGTETRLTELVGAGPWLCQIPRLSWSRDGGTLYTTASLGADPACGLVAIDVATRQVRSFLPPAEGSSPLEPAVSPDGSTVAFFRGVGLNATDLFLMSTHGGELRRLTYDRADLVGFDWLPDGKALVVASNREGGTRKLWRVPLDGSAMQSLTDGSSQPTFPSVNASGQMIVFTQFHVTAPIWKVQSGKVLEVLDNQSRNATPMISPDGRKMLYGSDRAGKWTVWLSNADGSDSRPLLQDSAYTAGAARWSPDGRQIAMDCQLARQTHICLSDSAGRGVHPLPGGNGNQANPSWSRDGRSLYYSMSVSGHPRIFHIDLASGITIPIADGEGTRAEESWDGKWLFLVRGGTTSRVVALPITGVHSAGEVKLLPELKASIGSSWDVCKEGIVYSAGDDASPRLEVYDMVTQSSRSLVGLSDFVAGDDLSLSVLPDGQSVVFTANRTHSELSMMSVRK